METCYKVFRREIIQRIVIEENRFGFEPEITAKIAKLRCRIYEVGISYYGRTYDEGKKIGWKDGVRAALLHREVQRVSLGCSASPGGRRAAGIPAGFGIRWGPSVSEGRMQGPKELPMSETPSTPSSFPARSVDLLLVHAPAFFDFRERQDIYFPYLSTSGDVPITPLYEYFPVGFKTLQRYLQDRGHLVAILNLSHRVDELSRGRRAEAAGVGRRQAHRYRPALDGPRARQPGDGRADQGNPPGYADRLRRHLVDLLRGPARGLSLHRHGDARLRHACADGEADDRAERGPPPGRDREPHVEARRRGGGQRPVVTPPTRSRAASTGRSVPKEKGAEILELLSTQNAGCAYNCGWCGGSREAFRRIFKRRGRWRASR